jgi:hypothetical protein
MWTVPYALQIKNQHDLAEEQHVRLKCLELQQHPAMHHQPKMTSDTQALHRCAPKCCDYRSAYLPDSVQDPAVAIKSNTASRTASMFWSLCFRALVLTNEHRAGAILVCGGSQRLWTEA